MRLTLGKRSSEKRVGSITKKQGHFEGGEIT